MGRILDSNVVQEDLEDYGKSGQSSMRHRYHLNCDISDMSEAFIRCIKRYKIFHINDHIIKPSIKKGRGRRWPRGAHGMGSQDIINVLISSQLLFVSLFHK